MLTRLDIDGIGWLMDNKVYFLVTTAAPKLLKASNFYAIGNSAIRDPVKANLSRLSRMECLSRLAHGFCI